MKHIFIINPTSGTGKYRILEDWLLTQNNLDYEVFYTEYVGHAQELAHSFGKDVVIYAVGGDGTAHEVLNGIHPEATMGMIPTGTGNDFAKVFGRKTSLIQTIEDTVLHGETRKIDVGSMNDKLFLNVTNLGIDADINERANNTREGLMPRKFVYLISALKEVFKIKPYPIRVKKDGRMIDASIALLCVMNGMYYGGGFKAAPLSVIDDGYLDLCMVDAISLSRALVLLPKYMRGKHMEEKEVRYEKIKRIEIESGVPLMVGCDGEIFKTTSIKIEVKKHYLNLRAPKNA